MPTFDIVKRITPPKSFRVESVKGQFDLSLEHVVERFKGSIDLDSAPWSVGVIYGASGTGKSTIAKELFPDAYVRGYEYRECPVIDDMPSALTTDEITRAFNSVGFATVWSWLKPYSVLSTGEKMRVDLARSILEKRELIVFDEFTSVVNREVAKTGSFAIQKAVRKSGKKFIAVTCHKDILEWLEPDWTFCTDTMTFDRGSLRRPELKLEVYRCPKSLWDTFRRYHYLNTSLNDSAHTWVGVLNGEPVVFCAVLHFPHPRERKFKRVHRLVTLPDFQGVGIGYVFMCELGRRYVEQGFRFIITSSNKSLFKSISRDKRWIITRKSRAGKVSPGDRCVGMGDTCTFGKYTFAYEFIGERGLAKKASA